jgi:CRISPR/Cas system-associated exonuclease Cas4 (RecB family)
MVAIKLNQISNPTLEAADRALEEESSENRSYLGASGIGEHCSRKLWYGFRWSKKIRFTARTLKAFADGHYQEEVQKERLKKVAGITVWGEQESVVEFGGHFKGHCDGLIKGILEAPKTDHVWEHKSVGEKKLAELRKLLENTDEKKALELWNEVYYAQALIYMHLLGVKRHFLTVSSAGGRDALSLRTNAAPRKAKALLKKAKEIIFAAEPPARDESYRCRWCDYKEICLEQSVPDKNCRTCMFSTPGEDGAWYCENPNSGVPIGRSLQKTGCDKHLFIPAMINAEQVNAVKRGTVFDEIVYSIGRNKKGTGRIDGLGEALKPMGAK